MANDELKATPTPGGQKAADQVNREAGTAQGQNKSSDSHASSTSIPATTGTAPIRASAAPAPAAQPQQGQQQQHSQQQQQSGPLPAHKTAPVTKGDVTIVEATGVLGGPFTIYGEGFGSSANVIIDSQSTKVTGVSNTKVRGLVPQGVRKGKVQATLNGVSFEMIIG